MENVNVWLSLHKTTWMPVHPDFLHFTPRANLAKIQQEGFLAGGDAAVVTGCVNPHAETTFAYCIDIVQCSRMFHTMPSGVLTDPDAWCALAFTSPVSQWKHTLFESYSEAPVDVRDALVLDVAEALDLLGVTVEAVTMQLAA